MLEKLPELAELESLVKTETFNKHQEEMDLMTGLLNTYMYGFNLIDSFTPSKDNEIQHAWMLLLIRSYHSMRCVIWLISKGYYTQAMSLLRSVTEDWFICLDCQGYRPTLEALLYGKYRLGSNKHKLRYWDMAQRTGKTEVYKQDFSFESKFTHATERSLAVLTDPDTYIVRTAPVYDEILFLVCCELMIRNALRMTEFMEAFLSRLSKEKVDIWRRAAGQPCKEASEWLKTIQEQYGVNK